MGSPEGLRHCSCVREEDAGEREAGAHFTTPTYTVRRDGPAREPSLSAFWLQKPSILRACVREEDAGGREAGAHSTTPTCTVRRDGPAREPRLSAFWLEGTVLRGSRACRRFGARPNHHRNDEPKPVLTSLPITH
jgi:hypothetical protein